MARPALAVASANSARGVSEDTGERRPGAHEVSYAAISAIRARANALSGRGENRYCSDPMQCSLPRRLALFAPLFLALACDRRLEPYVEPADEPARLERPVQVPGLENPAPRARMPMGPPAAAAASAGARTGASADGASIRGRVVAGEGVLAGGEGVLFVIARSSGGGPPLAVKRLPVGPFPLEFEIGPADVMMAGRPFAGPISLTARVDRDSNPLTRDPSDPTAELPAPVDPGAADVELRLERGKDD
jgi:hypothetical protein